MHVARIIDENNAPKWAVLDGDGVLKRARGSFEEGFEPTDQPVTPRRWLPPVEPRVILCIGRNYAAHAAEQDAPPPEYPVVFFKNPAAVVGHGEPIVLPKVCGYEVDYEGELVVVIGAACRDVAEQDALKHVLGYTIANDVSARTWQFEKGGSQWSRAKSFDTFCPMGPYLVTPDVVDPSDCGIRTTLNGNVVQDGRTRDMLFSVPRLIAFLSEGTTLLPGTVILTGTPSGIGWARTPRRMLEPGDVVSISVEGVGELCNQVAAG